MVCKTVNVQLQGQRVKIYILPPKFRPLNSAAWPATPSPATPLLRSAVRTFVLSPTVSPIIMFSNTLNQYSSRNMRG